MAIDKTSSSAKIRKMPSEQQRAEQIKTARKPKTKLKYRLFNLGVGLDLPLLIIVLTLLGMGLIMLFSASFPSALYYDGDSYADIKKQAVFAVVGVTAMLIISVVDYHQFRKYNFIMFAVTVGLLILVFVPGFSASRGEATRWVYFGGFSLQPSEIAKFTLIVMLAHVAAKAGDDIKTFKKGVVPCAIPVLIIVGLIAAEKHISATIIILCISAVVMFVSGIKVRWFVLVGGAVIFILVVAIFFTDIFSYALPRILGWLNPFDPPDGVDTYQTKQSLYAIGSGQLLGVGLGQSTQKYLYLPEAKNDFIFAIVCEELGFIGAMIVITLFVALVWRGIVISMNARDKFGSLLGMGITFTIGIQTAFNICVVTNAFPNTGVSLPFFSYGGTSLLMLLGEMGVLLSISRNSYLEKT